MDNLVSLSVQRLLVQLVICTPYKLAQAMDHHAPSGQTLHHAPLFPIIHHGPSSLSALPWPFPKKSSMECWSVWSLLTTTWHSIINEKKEQQGKQKCSRNNYNVFVSLSLLAGTSLKSSSQNKSKMLKRIIVTWLLCLQVRLLLARTSLQLESPLIPADQ